MEEQISAQGKAIDNAISAMGGKEAWLGAHQGLAWATIALAVLANNRNVYADGLAEATVNFLDNKSPESYAYMEVAAQLYRSAAVLPE